MLALRLAAMLLAFGDARIPPDLLVALGGSVAQLGIVRPSRARRRSRLMRWASSTWRRLATGGTLDLPVPMTECVSNRTSAPAPPHCFEWASFVGGIGERGAIGDEVLNRLGLGLR